jgi:hypothetical protein
MVSYFPYQPFPVDFELSKLTFTSEVPGDEINTDVITKLVPNGWHITSIRGPFYNVRANNDDTVCLLCERVHEHENQYIYVSPGQQNVFFKCHRAKDEGLSKQAFYLGTLNPEYVLTDEDRLRSVEYEYCKPQIETNDNYCTERVGFLNPTPRIILLICSFMGTGKTTAFNNYIRRTNAKRVLILSPRILYTESITSEYNQPQTNDNKSYLLPFAGKKFKTYLELNKNGKRKDFRKSDRLVIQMESLHNLLNVEAYDVLVLDEIESLLMQFGSETMREQILCTQVFERLIRETPIIIGGDAFLSEKSRKTLEQINRNINISRNDYKPPKRTAYMYPSYESLFYRAYQSLTQGKKIVFVCASRKKAIKFANGCTKRGIIFKLYTGLSKNTEIERQELSNVNVSWSDVQCVIYNSRITVGVNFNLEDIFQQLFVYGSSHACCVRDTFQGTLRVRHITENVMHVYIYQKAVNYRLPLKYDDIVKEIQELVVVNEMLIQNKESSILTIVEYEPEDKISNNPIVGEENTLQQNLLNLVIPQKQLLQKQERKIKREYKAKSIWSYAPEWLKICLVYNIMECNFSKVCYRKEFYKYLVRCNYKIMEVSPKNDEIDSGIVDTEQIKYSEISDITLQMYEDLELKIKAGIGNFMEHKMVDKYKFNDTIKELLPQNIREGLFNKFFASDKLHKSHFYNRYYEQYFSPEERVFKELHSKFVESASIHPVKLALIRNLNRSFGIQNSGQGFDIPEERFLHMAPLLSVYIPDMEKLFHVKSEDKNPSNNLIKHLDKVYREWSGTSIIRNSHRVQTKGIRQTFHSISKEHDQSVEDAIKPPMTIKTQLPVIDLTSLPQSCNLVPAQIPVNIDLTGILHLLNNDTLIVRPPPPEETKEDIYLHRPKYGVNSNTGEVVSSTAI